VRVTPDLDTINSLEICPKFYIQTYPAVTFDGQNYFVVWSDNNFGGSYYYVAAARVTPDGAVLDTGTCISSGTGSSEYRAKIAYDGNRCLVVWPKSSGPVYGRFINSQCQPEGNIFVIASAPAGGPDIAFGDTNYLVVWFSGVYPSLELHGQLVSTQGSLVGGPISIVLGSGCHRWADVTFDGTKYLVAWQTGENNVGQKIYGQFVGTDGSLMGGNFMICDNTTQERWWPAVAVSDSNYLVTWGQGYSSACDIWGNVDVAITGVGETAGYTFYDAGVNLTVSPNPYTKLTTVSFGIEHSAERIELKIYDVSGRIVKYFPILTSQVLNSTSVAWDGTDQAGKQVNGGVYFVRLVVDDYNATEKVLLIR
jgi:hypothetical protein